MDTRRKPGRRAALLATVAAGLALAGCTGPTDDEVTPGTSSPAAVIDGVESRSEQIVRCMIDRGLPVVQEAGGAYSFDNAVLDATTVDEEYRSCERELMDAGVINANPVDDPGYLESVFAELLVQAECLRNHGYPVADAPSQQAWVESKGAVWNPFDSVYASGTGDDIAAAESECA